MVRRRQSKGRLRSPPRSIVSRRSASSPVTYGIVALLSDDYVGSSLKGVRARAVSQGHPSRLASGTHREYEIALPIAEPRSARERMLQSRRHPCTSIRGPKGRSLRIIGQSLDESCGSLAEERAPAIIAATEARLGYRHPCHTPGYEPAWRKADRAKHEAALKARQQAQAEQERQANIRRVLSDARAITTTWQRGR